ncbi:MAG: AraC family transcriptional regulator [Deltaproteobacteria bacterium]|jgi:AraC-like DNA-binding protein|nr:AraC family transcriptional regulator [Deltaproteobacteria bacterium]
MAVTHLLSPTDILWKLLEGYGHDAESIFLKVGIHREMILKPGARIAHARVDSLWSKINELIDDPCFGLHGAKFWHPSQFNALGHAWLASSTLREALNRAVRYAHINGTDRKNRLKDTAKGLTFTLSQSLRLPAFIDMAMSILMSACRLNYGPDLNPVEVNFIHSKPACAEEYYSFFKAPVNFSADSDCITLPADAVDSRLPVGNPELAQICDQYITSYLAELDKNNIVQRVKTVIIDLLPSGGVSDEKVAQRLKMSTRSLQRKLQDARTTFGTLLDEVRQELAEHYIHDSTVSLTEIAFVLGYSEYSSFWRAYKRWTKTSPSEIRKLEPNINA